MRAFFLGLMLPTLVSVAHATAGDHRVWIEASLNDGLLMAQPRVEAGHDALLDYELISTKAGKAGRSNSSQAGSVRVTQGETRSLTHLRLSIAGDDKYILSLRVYENGRLVGEDSVTFP
jgi:hypothetical protein